MRTSFLWITVLFWLVGLAALPVPAQNAIVGTAQADTSVIPPNLVMRTAHGGQVTAAHLAGKVVIINFWASWCPPCLEELPELVRIQNTYQNQGVVVLGINYTDNMDDAGIVQFGLTNGITFPLLNSRDPNVMAFVQAFGGVVGLPTNVVLNRAGQVVYSQPGPLDQNGYASLIQPHL